MVCVNNQNIIAVDVYLLKKVGFVTVWPSLKRQKGLTKIIVIFVMNYVKGKSMDAGHVDILYARVA